MNDVLAADFGIRQLHARYVDAVWRKDGAAVARCYDEEGEWHIVGQSFHGRTEIAEALERFMAPQHSVLMHVGIPLLDIAGETATGRVYVTEEVKRIDGGAGRNIGFYDDRYAGDGTMWRFLSRRFTMAYRGPPDLSEPYLI